MKKYLVTLVLMLPLAASAQTVSSTADFQVLIEQLQAQTRSLHAQIADLQSEVRSVKLELKFSRALAQGATGDDVKQLQEFLKTFTGSYPNGSITGYFGPRTAIAVKKFQEQNGIESVGIVGPKTQEKLNVLAAAIPAISATPAITPDGTYVGETAPALPTDQTTIAPAIPATQGGPTVSAIPATPCRTPIGVQIQQDVVTVLSPNGGEKWQVGGTYTIRYSAKDIVGNKALLIYLEKGYDAPTTKTGANSGHLIGVTTNLESYTYAVPRSIQSWPGFGSNYKITIMVEGSYSSCGAISYIGDSSDAEFSIVAGQNNVPGTSGGGYGVSATPAPVMQNIQITQDKIANLQAQIVALKEKLNTTTDAATRNSLAAQIAALQKIVQELQNQIYQGKLLPVTVSAVSATTITPASGGGYGQEDKIFTLQAQISALQEKLNTITDIATRDSLMAQIAALKTQVVVLVKARQSQTTRDPLSILYAQHSALTNQFNSTTDPATRNALWAQQTAVSNQIQALTPPEPTTQKQINSLLEEINAYQGKLNLSNPDAEDWDWLTSRIAELRARIQILESNPTTPAVQLLFAQIIALQNQLNAATDATVRNSLISQIVALKARMASESNPAMPIVQPATPTLSGTTSAPVPIQGASISAQITSANQDKINSLFEQITGLQNQLNGTMNTAIRDSLMAQIVALKTQVKELESTRDADVVILLIEQVRALQEKLNRTTDATERDSLKTQIDELMVRVQALHIVIEDKPKSVRTPETADSAVLSTVRTLRQSPQGSDSVKQGY